ncbi:MAG: hypothetical protein EBE86_018365 [Hormoscilla sp. GUM202]|nr:hypothetical protein [Hormoscilla sp. GUM202]
MGSETGDRQTVADAIVNLMITREIATSSYHFEKKLLQMSFTLPRGS